MDDDFLYQIRPPVRKAFAGGLRQRLSSHYPEGYAEGKGPFRMDRLLMPPLAWKFLLLFALALMALTFAFSGQVRASALRWIRVIAGFNVEERSESPLQSESVPQGVEQGEIPPAQTGTQTAPAGAPAQTETPERGPTRTQPFVTVTIPTLSLPEALENPPFPFDLPNWTPEGYTLGEQVAIANSQDWVMLTWRSPEGSEITLLVEREYGGYNLPAGEASSQEIEINGQPALLIRGGWGAEHQWDPRLGIAIYWEQGGRAYRLIYSQRDPNRHEIKPIEGDPEAVVRQLIRMAESTR